MRRSISRIIAALLSGVVPGVIGQTSDYGDFSGLPSASSTVDSKLSLGRRTDADTAINIIDIVTGLVTGTTAASNAAATSDDLNSFDDEDAATVPAAMPQGAVITIPLTLINNTGADAYLNAWIDFDNSGAISDALYSTPGGEKLTNQIVVPNSGGGEITRTITFSVPPAVRTGQGRGVRIRLTSVSDPGPDGADGIGEVEDYVVEIGAGGYAYGIAAGSLYQISLASGQAMLAGDIDPAISSSGNGLAYIEQMGAAGVLIYSTGSTGDLRLGVWDRATGAGNIAGNLRSFGMPSGALLRSGGEYGGYYWTILDESDDLWKVSVTGTSGNYVITSATKVADIWGNARAHGFGDIVVRPDGTMLALGDNSDTGEAEFFTANLSLASPVASLLGKPPIFQNGTALGLDGRLFGGLGLSAENSDWYELNPANGSIMATIVTGNIDGVSDMTLAASTAAPSLSPQDDYGDSSLVPTASSTRMNNLRLGGLTDAEYSPSSNAAATGDDTTGSDDEDGVLMPSSIGRGSAVTIPVNVFNSTIPTSFLNAWMDLNNNGQFDDRLISAGGEKLMAEITVASSGSISTQNITFTVPATASLGINRAVRFRLTSSSNPGPYGKSGNGEVEDYAVTIATATAAISLGDRVFLDVDNNAAQTARDTGISGAAVNLFSSTDATRGNADDRLVGQAVTDAGGFYQFGGPANTNMMMVPGPSTSIARGPAVATDDAEELVSGGAVNTGDSDLELGSDGVNPQVIGLCFPGVDVPQGAIISSATIQFMADETQTGAVTLAIQGGNTDNATTFTTTAGSISSRPRTAASVLWSPPDWYVGERGAGQLTPNLSAIVQEIVQRGGWARGNAISFLIRRSSGAARRTAETQASGSAQWAVLNITYYTTSPATIQLSSRYFITLAANDPSLAGTIPVTPYLTGTAPADPHSSAIANNLIDSNGVVSGTEIVASVLTSSTGGSNPGYDLGFAPASDFGDYLGFPAASSTRKATLKIGVLTDTEMNDAAKDATATGDDLAILDDEDGVTLPGSVFQGQATATMTVNVTNTTTAAASLNVWIDFNRDNDVLDAGEQIVTNISIAAGTAGVNRSLSFTVPTGASPGVAGVRVRLTSINSPGADGADGDGEVEDNVITILPVRLDALMEVRPAGTAAWSPAIALQAGRAAEFQLTLTNSGALALRDPVAIDLLPAPGDIGAVDLRARNSQWRPLLGGPVSAPPGIRPWYSLVQNPRRPEVITPDPAGSTAPAWFALPADPGTVRSLKFDGTGLTIAPGSSITISWTMWIPWDAPALTSAWNSAGISVIRTDSGTRMTSYESPRAGIQALVPGGEFYGDKVWADTNSDGLQTAGESGLNGVLVEFYRDNGDGNADPGTDTFVSATYTATVSGQAGIYRFGQFPPGSYFAVIRPPDGWDIAPGERGGNDGLDSDALETVRAGRRTGTMPVTRIDPGESDLTWDAGLVSISGKAAVWAIAATSSGSMVLGGNFTKSHGTPRRNIARVTPAGTLDTTFNPGSGFDGTVRSVALRSDGMVWVGGSFSSFNGYPAAGVALLTAAGGWDARAAQPDTCMVNWVGTSGNTMYLAGSFTRVGGIPCGNIARLTASGSVDTGFNRGAGTNGPIYDAAILPSGRILIAGNFTSVHGIARKGIARLNSDGSVDSAFDPRSGPSGEIYSIKPIEDGRMTLTGNFRSFAGITCNGAVRLLQDGRLDGTMRPSALSVESINSSQ